MNKREFPHLKLLKTSYKGNYFGAFVNKKVDAQQGYVVFLSAVKHVRNYCECKGWSIRESCYHMKEAKKLEGLLFEKSEGSEGVLFG